MYVKEGSFCVTGALLSKGLNTILACDLTDYLNSHSGYICSLCISLWNNCEIVCLKNGPWIICLSIFYPDIFSHM